MTDSPIRCVLHESARAVLDAFEADLRARESENSLILGLLYGLVSGERRSEALVGASLTRGDTLLGFALRTVPDTALLLTGMPDEAVDCLVQTLDEAGIELTGVNGVCEASVRFAESWARRRSLNVTQGMKTGLFELTAVQMPDLADGRLGRAEPDDEATLEAFLTAFFRETDPTDEAPNRKARAVLQRLAPMGRVYTWRDRGGHLVSTVSVVRETPDGASISLVYTPPEHRGCGHASRAVASLSQRILDGGRSRCNLYTDLANPTSNAIYPRVGYRALDERWAHHFTAP